MNGMWCEAYNQQELVLATAKQMRQSESPKHWGISHPPIHTEKCNHGVAAEHRTPIQKISIREERERERQSWKVRIGNDFNIVLSSSRLVLCLQWIGGLVYIVVIASKWRPTQKLFLMIPLSFFVTSLATYYWTLQEMWNLFTRCHNCHK